MQSIELIHKSGVKYVIADIPMVEETQKFKFEWDLQKFINEIEAEYTPYSEYSYLEYNK